MSKKTYTKPTVASRTAVLGVFGAYGNDPNGAGGNTFPPQPYKPLTDHNRHMQ